MPFGIITKGIGGFYYVQYDNSLIECKVRGKFRKQFVTPMIGDNSEFEYVSETTGVITNICERKNFIIRPPVANIDQVIIVFAATHPEPNLLFIDKMIAELESKEIQIGICINKIDLDTDKNYLEISKIYKDIGYPVLNISVAKNIGIDEVKVLLSGKVSALSGSSGVGKSSLLNMIHEFSNAKTGELSQKVGRGKHTTRHVELFKLEDNGYILDTPGFSMIDLNDLHYDDLKFCFREFIDINYNCKFKSCSHINEPDCAIKKAIENNTISLSRYESYKMIYNELKSKTQYK